MNKQQIRPLRYIRKNFEWRDYIESHYDVKYAGDHELRINCPNCGDNKHKLYVNDEKKVFHCFKCTFTTRKGAFDVFDFVAITEGLTKGQAILKLLHEYKPVTPDNFENALKGVLDDIPEPEKKFKHPYLTSMPAVAKKLENITEESRPFWDYLFGRGLTEREITRVLQTYVVPIKSHEILGHNGRRKGDIGRRILWPIYGGDHRLVSWQARAFENPDDVKYFNAPDTDISATLWPYVAPTPDATVVLCEGLLDAVSLRRLPKKYAAYATFTKSITKDQISLLTSWNVKNVILFWDPDAKSAISSAVEMMKLHFSMYVPDFSQCPDNWDPGDCMQSTDGVGYLHAAVENAIPVDTLEYLRWRIK